MRELTLDGFNAVSLVWQNLACGHSVGVTAYCPSQQTGCQNTAHARQSRIWPSRQDALAPTRLWQLGTREAIVRGEHSAHDAEGAATSGFAATHGEMTGSAPRASSAR